MERPSVAGVGRAGFIRDPSGLLMSIIRTLATSGDDHHREQEKERLEEAFGRSDEKLDELVANNYEELAKTIKQFGKIGDRISDSRLKIKQVKENLQHCKSLLHCRQDELRKLWLEGVEHKRVLWLLDQIDEVRASPKNIEKYMSEKKYLDATQLITKVIGQLTNELAEVEALNDIRNELLSQKITMHEGFINELHHQLYFSFNSQSSSAPNNDQYPVLGVLLESLKQLGKIPDAVEAIKSQMDRYINMVVVNASIEIADLSFGKEESDNPKRLLQLLESLFLRFRGVANSHTYILDRMKHMISMRSCSDVVLYEMFEVWSKIQTVLQLLLHDYLDADSIAATSQQMHGLGFSEITGSTFSSHFARKKVQRQRVAKLFRFEASSHAISMNTYLREQRAEKRIHSGNTGEPQVIEHNATAQKVCKPSSRNIILIFGPLQLFVEEIEKSLSLSKNKKCSLHEYITDYIQNVFIRQSQYEMKKLFDAASKVTDPLKVLGHPTAQQDDTNTDKLIIQSALVVDQCVLELYTLMTNLQGYYDQFLAMVCSLLHEYKETLVQSYRSVVQPESEDQRITSAAWIRDVEVNKVLRGLLNWQNVKNSSVERKPGKDDIYSQKLLSDFSKEARFFTDNLLDEFIGKNSMVEDINDMAAIANLHESLEWLSIRLKRFMSRICNDAPEDTMNMLNQLSKEYEGMCDTCLLCLHIEVRVRCFYFLSPVFRNNNFDIRAMDSIENDPMVVKLSKDITDIDIVIRECLQPSKHRYVFQGLGHHIAAIFISGIKYLKRISQTGIKKMSRNIFTLQQVLTHVTASRETHLDAARQFYEMLYNGPDDLQGIVMEQGVQFDENDYVQAIELLHRSRPGSGTDTVRMARIQRLREIIREQATKNNGTTEIDKENAW